MERELSQIPFPEGWTPRILDEIDMPLSLDLALFDKGDAILINDDAILAFKFMQRDRGFPPSDTLLVCRERSKPVKVIKKGGEIAIPAPDQAGTFGVLMLNTFHKRLYIGEDYRVQLEDRNREDVYRGRLRLRISSPGHIQTHFIPGKSNYSMELASLRNS